MNTERLCRLADWLEQVVARAPETFDMDIWSSERECGTACCAGGHACIVPEFHAAGLRLGLWTGIPEFRDALGVVRTAFDAMAAFFEITHGDALYLFDSGKYPVPDHITPLEVAARIRGLAAMTAY